MTKIESTFNDVLVCHGDIWIADYTEKTKTYPKEERKGVTIQEKPFDDIASFHLQNKEGIDILAVNFERNKGFFPHNFFARQNYLLSLTKGSGSQYLKCDHQLFPREYVLYFHRLRKCLFH